MSTEADQPDIRLEDLTDRDKEFYGPQIKAGLALEDLTEEERRFLVILLNQPGWAVNLPWLASRRSEDKAIAGRISPEAVRRRCERAGQRLQHHGLIDITKEDDGLTWYRARPPALLDLIRAPAKFQPEEKSDEPDKKRGARRSPLDIPSNASGARLNAIRHLRGIRMVGKGDDLDLRAMFSGYLDKINEQIITLIHKGTGELAGLEYSTRFNDQRRVLKNLDRYDYAMDLSAQQHFRAVFLTLTTDPKLHDSNWDANRSMTRSWNKFLSFLTKRMNGKRPKYISSFEFTKSGLLHVHAIIYVPYLIRKQDITDEWKRCGQGEINYIYRLKSRDGRWIWAGEQERPPDAQTGDAGQYLKKYLKKCLFATRDGAASSEDSPLYMFWAINKRFWTSSRCFLPPAEEKGDVLADPTWSFYQVMDEERAANQIDMMLYHRLEPPDEKPPWMRGTFG